MGFSGKLVQPVPQASEPRGLGAWRGVAARRWRCEDCRLELLGRRVTAAKRGLDSGQLRFEGALLGAGRVCHLAQALVEAHLVVGKLRGEAVELPSQQACGNQLLFHHHNALGEED